MRFFIERGDVWGLGIAYCPSPTFNKRNIHVFVVCFVIGIEWGPMLPEIPETS